MGDSWQNSETGSKGPSCLVYYLYVFREEQRAATNTKKKKTKKN